MIIVGIKFKNVGKIYYFDPEGVEYNVGEKVVVETSRGLEIGNIVLTNKDVSDDSITSPLKPVIRRVNDEDIKNENENKRAAKEAMKICNEKIRQHKLDMKLIDTEYTLDRNKILFYFTSEGRVDFRNLVKDLAAIFRVRVELRQIGVRDQAKMVGGLGVCGKKFCCSTFLSDFQPVSIKMAKEQGISLNPTKISGMCGRLMCCLNYEQEAYEDLIRTTPTVGSIVKTKDGKGTVVEVNLLRGNLKIKFENNDVPKMYHKDDVKVIKRAVAENDNDKICEDINE